MLSLKGRITQGIMEGILREKSPLSIQGNGFYSVAEAMLAYPNMFNERWEVMDRMAKEGEFDELEIKYLTTPFSLSNYYYAFHLVDAIRKEQEGRELRLLDVGCAYGLFVAFMRDLGFDAQGMDRAFVAIKMGDVLGIGGLRVGDMRNLESLYHEKFDVITCIGVLNNHDPDGNFARLIRNSAKLLCERGVLIFSVLEIRGKEEEILLKSGFDPIVKNWWGCTALQLKSVGDG